MELHVTGRHVQLKDDFREHADERLAKLDQLVHGDRRADVVVTKDGHGEGVIVVEITLHGKPPVIRAEARDPDKLVAFDQAFAKVSDRVRKAHERRRSGRRRVVAAPTPDVVGLPGDVPAPPPGTLRTVEEPAAASTTPAPAPATAQVDDGPEVVEIQDTPIEVRVKRHAAEPMTIEQAVYEMEMVGHDFYLFTDSESGLPSALYRRRGWSYGVLHLESATAEQGRPAVSA